MKWQTINKEQLFHFLRLRYFCKIMQEQVSVFCIMNTIKIEKADDKELNKKESGIFSKLKTALGVGTAASLIFLAAENGIAQTTNTPDKKLNYKNITIGVLDSLIMDVSKYYPDMKKHLQDMIGTIVTPERKTAVNDILNNTVMQASNEQQKIGWCIYAIETYVATGKEFGDKYDATITDETFALMDEFNKQYDAWFDAYISKLKAELEENKGELAKKLEHIESNMKCFTPEQVKKNPKLKALVLETEAAYKKAGFHLSEHFKTLIEAAK